jgi:hypothetical protein
LGSEDASGNLSHTARGALPAGTRTLAYRPRGALPMDPSAVPGDAVLLLDTTVYIDGMKRAGLPLDIQALLADRMIRHSPLCVGELAFGVGRLDPSHRETERNRSVIIAILDQFAPGAFVNLRSVWLGEGGGSGRIACAPSRVRAGPAAHAVS